MPEQVYKSAGVFTREIDTSQPSAQGITGVPAGIVGTANLGPAYVPLVFGNINSFVEQYGNIDGSSFGRIAAQEYLTRGGSAVAYVRVLGVGDGKKRNSNGSVTNAGFVVGDRLVQAAGDLANNPYANAGSGDIEGRTYFLGCFMSESNGSTIFSEAGIQTSGENIAAPILRGVLLAPSGVVLSLSSSFDNGHSQHPLKTTTATDGTDVNARYGQLTGSVVMGNSGQFSLLLNGYKGEKSNVITASFDPTQPNYFANTFNTDPFKIEEEGHYLYASYDIYNTYADITGSGVVASNKSSTHEDIAFILTGSNARGLSSGLGDIPDYEDFQDRFTHAESPYIVSQDNGGRYDLFKLIALSPGEDFSRKYKFSILNINKAQETFDLVIRERSDTDKNSIRVPGETYNGLSLNPNSDNYIARVIGDLNVSYQFDTDARAQKIVVEGTHPNQSKLVRVKVSNDVANKNIPAGTLPFGFRGPMHTVTSGSMLCGGTMPDYIDSDILNRVIEPPIPFRENISIGTGNAKAVDADYFWGVQTQLKTSISEPNLIDNELENIPDVTLAHVTHFPTHRTNTTAFAVRDNNGAADVNGSVLDSDRFNNNLFVLENVRVRTGSSDLNNRADPDQWVSASYVRGGGITINDANKTRALSPNDLDLAANQKYVKFTCLFQGGFNGTNIFDQEKYNLTNLAVKREKDNPTTQGGTKSGPTINAYRKALDILGSKSDIDIQLLAVPGQRNSSVTDYAIDVAENRFDCLYIMDIEERDSDNIVITGSNQTPSITYTLRSFVNRSLDTSFAAAYFPDVNSSVRLSDGSESSKRLPPSVAVLGAYANNDSIGQSWFAPAGKNRGTLPSVTSTTLGVLTRDAMDDLYSGDINPIQTEDGSGVTIQGQKTLLKNLSALDRVNVRRLLINIRRAVRNISNSLIFEPNRKETLDKFRSRINPVLEAIKGQGGVSRYKVVIDNTTTTQADVENNTVRGKIYIQPVRVAEFIALDFNITNQIID